LIVAEHDHDALAGCTKGYKSKLEGVTHRLLVRGLLWAAERPYRPPTGFLQTGWFG
jgi:hypothetical protein